jgi:hypothetical protein
VESFVSIDLRAVYPRTSRTHASIWDAVAISITMKAGAAAYRKTSDPWARLRGLIRVYVHFATNNPAYFRIMFDSGFGQSTGKYRPVAADVSAFGGCHRRDRWQPRNAPCCVRVANLALGRPSARGINFRSLFIVVAFGDRLVATTHLAMVTQKFASCQCAIFSTGVHYRDRNRRVASGASPSYFGR